MRFYDICFDTISTEQITKNLDSMLCEVNKDRGTFNQQCTKNSTHYVLDALLGEVG